MQYRGLIEIPLFNAGFSLPEAESDFQKFQYSSLSAVVANVWSSDGHIPGKVDAWIMQPGNLSYSSRSGSTSVRLQGSSWSQGFLLTMTDGNFVTPAAPSIWSGPLQSLGGEDQDYFNKSQVKTWTTAGTDAPFSAVGPYPLPSLAGETVETLNYGAARFISYANPMPPPDGANMIQVLSAKGIDNIGFAIFDPGLTGGDWMAGAAIFLNAEQDRSSGIRKSYTWLPRTVNRGDLLTVCNPIAYETPSWLTSNGFLKRPTYGVAELDDADQRTSSIFRNGWTFVMKGLHLSSPDAVWVIIVTDFAMDNYWIVRVNPQVPEAEGILADSANQPEFKIDASGIAWMMNGTGDGQVFTSFTENIAFAPTVYPMPTATFSLPCFDPCDNQLWDSIL